MKPIYIINPEWRDAPFELRLMKKDKSYVNDPYPHRFLEKDKEEIIRCMKDRDWEGLLKLSLPKFILISELKAPSKI